MATPNESQPLLDSIHSSTHSQSISISLRKNGQATILATVALERMAFYALAGNLYLFLNQRPLLWISYDAMTAFYILTGIVYFGSLFGGCLGDSIGKFPALTASLVLYTLGYSALVYLSSSTSQSIIPSICAWASSNSSNPTITRAENDTEPCKWLVYVIIVSIAIAASTIKANISPFGADQVIAVGEETTRRFFNLFYWCVNIGALVALGGFAYVQQSTTWGFFLGYLLPCICIAVALLVFTLGKRYYVLRKPTGSAVFDILRIVRQAWKAKRRRKLWLERQSSSLRDKEVPHPSWLDMAKVRYGGNFHDSAVDDVKTLGKILIVFVILIPYWTVYFQMHTGFAAQGLHMKLNPYATPQSNADSNMICNSDGTCTDKFMIPSAWLTLFDVVCLLILIPLMEKVVYPFLDRRHIHINVLTKICLGMVFAFLSVMVAGCLESYRLTLVNSSDGHEIVQIIGNTTFYAADIWIFWQAPQYALIGFSEVFASVSSLEFAYSQAPNSIKSMIMGFHYMFAGVGSFLGIGIMQCVRPAWFSDQDNGNINFGHLDYYFFLLGGIQLAAIVLFVAVALRYRVGSDRTAVDLSDEQPSTQ